MIPPAPSLLRGCVAAAALALATVPAAAPAAPASDRIASAIKSSVKSDRNLRAFYNARGNRPLWVRGGFIGPEADRLIELVESADIDGLDPDEYRPSALRRALENAREGSPKALARAELLLSRAFADYARDLRRTPAVQMTYLDRELAPSRPTAKAVLDAAASASSLEDHIANLRWMNPLYGQLRRGIAEYRGRWARLPQVYVPDGPLLKPGASGDRVRILRQRLGLSPYGDFDGELARALREFQAAHGLPVDAVAGPKTLAALNDGPDHRERLIRVNLERARALPPSYGRRHIVVDAAGARLYLYENGQVADTMKVIVGKPTEQTPMLAGMMRYAVVNPYWNVPPDLVRRRVAPGVLKEGPAFLKKMRYEVLSDWSHDAKILNPRNIDWAAVAAGQKELRVRQLPGRGNAMGKMKFMFPNDYGVYLHDTPEKELFQSADRQFSSGCVRVEDAQRLARWLFGKPLVAKSDKPEQQVPLPEPVPVFLTYLTAAPAGEGIAFRGDPYNRDRTQLAQMGFFAGSP